MNFSVLDHYNGFVLNNFIKKDNTQIDLLNKISLTWNQYNKNNLFFSKNKKKVFTFMVRLVQARRFY
jgi:hypothetical protein